MYSKLFIVCKQSKYTKIKWRVSQQLRYSYQIYSHWMPHAVSLWHSTWTGAEQFPQSNTDWALLTEISSTQWHTHMHHFSNYWKCFISFSSQFDMRTKDTSLVCCSKQFLNDIDWKPHSAKLRPSNWKVQSISFFVSFIVENNPFH